ncbi:hypothetical protein D3C76_1240340 [compost metagenome]
MFFNYSGIRKSFFQLNPPAGRTGKLDADAGPYILMGSKQLLRISVTMNKGLTGIPDFPDPRQTEQPVILTSAAIGKQIPGMPSV